VYAALIGLLVLGEDFGHCRVLAAAIIATGVVVLGCAPTGTDSIVRDYAYKSSRRSALLGGALSGDLEVRGT
jgi:predicted Na+-dependent transporter